MLHERNPPGDDPQSFDEELLPCWPPQQHRMHPVTVPRLCSKRLLRGHSRHRQGRGPRPREPAPQIVVVPSGKSFFPYGSISVAAAAANVCYPGPCRLPSARRPRVFPVHAGPTTPDERLRRGKGFQVLRVFIPPELLRQVSEHRDLPRVQERHHGRRPLHRPKSGPTPPSEAAKNRRRPTEQRGPIRANRLPWELHQLGEATPRRIHVQIGKMPKHSPASHQARDDQEAPPLPLHPAKSEQSHPTPPPGTPNHPSR